MKTLLVLMVAAWTLSSGVGTAQTATRPCPEVPDYGQNADAGNFVRVNGISLYYETYGEGPALLLIHGNGGSLNRTRCQIPYFARSHRVIAADSRGHGRSEDGIGPLTYEQIADDLAALLQTLKIARADVVGHSDGGIVALLLAIRHPGSVDKVVAASANLRPDESALLPSAIERTRADSTRAAEMIKAGDRSQDWIRRKRQIDMMLDEPHIATADLKRIASPTLVIAADTDIMPIEHTLEIFRAIPRAQLFVVPGATHSLPAPESDIYNFVVGRFLNFTFARRSGQPPAAGPQ